MFWAYKIRSMFIPLVFNYEIVYFFDAIDLSQGIFLSDKIEYDSSKAISGYAIRIV
jgi:hypothetical protein